jgi:Zn-dependent protease with chaperone function
MDLFVLYFGPGIPSQGERIPIRITSNGLILRSGQPGEERIPFETLRVTAGGFDHNQMTLTWTKAEETWSLILTDLYAKERFLKTAPPFLAPQLMQWRKQTTRVQQGMRIGAVLLGFLILFPLLLGLALWWKSDAIAEWAVHRISHTSEVKFGDLVYEQTRVGLAPLPEGETTKMVQEIGNRLTKGSPYPFKWHVADDPTVNAFAIPGGHVVVFTGLIQAAESPEEVAGILVHEAEHVLQRHSLKGMVHQLGWRVILSLLIGDVGGGQIGRVAAELQVLSFGRNQESEADLKGLTLLKGAKIDPKGMITFFDRLSKKEGASIAFLSTHPASADRAEALRAEINRLGPWQSEPLPYDWDVIKKELES